MITIEHLTKNYGSFRAVDDISLDIPPGQILGLLGPNGAGKTTTLRMLTGFFPPSSGTIAIKDLQMPKDCLAAKSLMGYLPESAPLYQNMLVYDYLSYVARIKGLTDPAQKNHRFRELAKTCGLSSIMGKPISTLSKGLKQRVGLAHAMMTDPEILILDEPTSGLDPNQIAEIRDIIKAIGKEKTIIFSTHILSEAEATCDRIVIINKGKIAADDTTSNLALGCGRRMALRMTLKGPSEDQVSQLFSNTLPLLEIRPAQIHPAVQNQDQAISFDILAPADTDPREELYCAIKKTDWFLIELTQTSQGLEKIFQELTAAQEG